MARCNVDIQPCFFTGLWSKWQEWHVVSPQQPSQTEARMDSPSSFHTGRRGQFLQEPNC